MRLNKTKFENPTYRKVTLQITGNIRILLLWKIPHWTTLTQSIQTNPVFNRIYAHLGARDEYAYLNTRKKLTRSSKLSFILLYIWNQEIIKYSYCFSTKFFIFWIYLNKDMYCKLSVHILVCTMYLLGM